MITLIQQCDGVTSVQANPLTGSVLILFSVDETRAEAILETLREAGQLGSSAASPTTSKGIGLVLNWLAKSAVETMLERAILALL